MEQEINKAKAYLDGMLWAAFGVRVISEDAVEKNQGDRNFHTSLKHTIDTIYSLENRYLCVA